MAMFFNLEMIWFIFFNVLVQCNIAKRGKIFALIKKKKLLSLFTVCAIDNEEKELMMDICVDSLPCGLVQYHISGSF